MRPLRRRRRLRRLGAFGRSLARSYGRTSVATLAGPPCMHTGTLGMGARLRCGAPLLPLYRRPRQRRKTWKKRRIEYQIGRLLSQLTLYARTHARARGLSHSLGRRRRRRRPLSRRRRRRRRRQRRMRGSKTGAALSPRRADGRTRRRTDGRRDGLSERQPQPPPPSRPRSDFLPSSSVRVRECVAAFEAAAAAELDRWSVCHGRPHSRLKRGGKVGCVG